MGISDLLSLISIILAILAFLDSSDRSFIKIKFVITDYVILVLIFLLLNFLIFYDDISQTFISLKTYEFDHFPKASIWAYILSVITIVWIIVKIFFMNFPKSNNDRLIYYYQNLMLKNEYARVSSLVLKYHKDLNVTTNDFDKQLVKEILSNQKFMEATIRINEKLFKKISKVDASFLNKFLLIAIRTEQLSNENIHFFSEHFSRLIMDDLANALIENPRTAFTEKLKLITSISKEMITKSSMIGYYSVNKIFAAQMLETSHKENIGSVLTSSNFELLQEASNTENHFALLLESHIYLIEKIQDSENSEKITIKLLDYLQSNCTELNVEIIKNTFEKVLEKFEISYREFICKTYDTHFPNTESLFGSDVINKLKDY